MVFEEIPAPQEVYEVESDQVLKGALKDYLQDLNGEMISVSLCHRGNSQT